jgi:hypothetical protein
MLLVMTEWWRCPRVTKGDIVIHFVLQHFSHTSFIQVHLGTSIATAKGHLVSSVTYWTIMHAQVDS